MVGMLQNKELYYNSAEDPLGSMLTYEDGELVAVGRVEDVEARLRAEAIQQLGISTVKAVGRGIVGATYATCMVVAEMVESVS